MGVSKLKMQQLTTYLQCLILDNNNIIDMIDNFISEFSITNSWNAEKWSRLMEDVKNMTDGDSRKRSMRKLRAIVFAANKFILNKGNYVTHQGLVNMPIFQSYDKIYKQPITVNHIRRIEAETIFGVLNMDCIDAGKMLQEEGYHPAVLNMACEDGPGGGVIGGCYGQEESLFRRSNLYVYLYPYSPHALECNLQSKHPQYPLNGNFDGIYVRDAVIFREAENKGYELLQNPFNMSFISVPAIREPILNDGMLNKRDIIIAKDKIRTILRLGLINSHDALVLGAWGCGIFHNPPRDIARLFKEVFLEEEFFNKYKKVVFAILDDSISLSRKKDDGNLLPFKELFVNKFVISRYDSFMSVSKGSCVLFEKLMGLNVGDVKVVYNPVLDNTYYDKLSKEPYCDWLKNKIMPTMVAAGAFSEIKGHLVLFEAIRIANETTPVRLVLFGKGHLQKNYEKWIAENHMQERILLAGHTSNLPAEIKKSDAFVISSQKESFSVVLVEAMAADILVISTDCPYGPPELLQYGKYGVLVPVGDSKAMAQAIVNQVNNPRKPAPKEAWTPFALEKVVFAYEKAIGLV